MTNDQWVRVLESLLEKKPRRSVPLTTVIGVLRSWGVVPAEDKKTQGMAVAAFLRSLLEDEEVQALLKATQELQILTSSLDLVSKKIPTPQQVGFWNTYSQSKKRLEDRIQGLQNKNKDKLEMIQRVSELLKELGHDEDYELPELEGHFPSLD